MAESFIVFSDWQKAIKNQPDSVRLEVLEAVFIYGETGVVPEFHNDISSALFLFIKMDMDRNKAKRDSVIEARTRAGKLGGRPRKYYNAEQSEENSEIQNKAKKPNAFFEKQKNQTKAKKPNESKKSYNVNGNVNVNVNGNGNEDSPSSFFSKNKDSESVEEKNSQKKNPLGGFSESRIVSPQSEDVLLVADTKPEVLPFSDFWAAYPSCKRKADRLRCESAWSRLGNEDRQRCIEAVKVWAASDDWREQGGQFIPAPLVFLHQRRWEAALPGASRKPQSDNGVYRTPDYGEKITQMRTSGIDVKVFEVD